MRYLIIFPIKFYGYFLYIDFFFFIKMVIILCAHKLFCFMGRKTLYARIVQYTKIVLKCRVLQIIVIFSKLLKVTLKWYFSNYLSTTYLYYLCRIRAIGFIITFRYWQYWFNFMMRNFFSVCEQFFYWKFHFNRKWPRDIFCSIWDRYWCIWELFNLPSSYLNSGNNQEHICINGLLLFLVFILFVKIRFENILSVSKWNTFGHLKCSSIFSFSNTDQ